MSDLHLETPKARPSYEDFEIQPQCKALALLGDIGNVSDSRLFDFLNRQLQQFEIIFYVLGNHEPYGSTLADAKAALRTFEYDTEKRCCSPGSMLRMFVFMDQRKYDWSEETIVLGCTLFSSIHPKQHDSVSRFVSDFSSIQDWTVESHNLAHEDDLQWLNAEVSRCTQMEPHRSIVIMTHHSPTILEEANDPRHVQDYTQVKYAFVTDLSEQVCWTSPQVKLWAFGHTHFNCDLADPQTGKRILANQKGYRRAEVLGFEAGKVVTIDVDRRSLCEDVDRRANKKSSKRKPCVVS